MSSRIVPVALVATAASIHGADSMENAARMKMIHSSTRAEANFRVADNLDSQLRQQGLTINAQLITMRLRIESAMDQARAAMEKSDWAAMDEALTRADAILDRFAKRIGGD